MTLILDVCYIKLILCALGSKILFLCVYNTGYNSIQFDTWNLKKEKRKRK